MSTAGVVRPARAAVVRPLAALALMLGGSACAPDEARIAPPGWTFSHAAELRPDSPRSTELFRYDVGDVVESLASPTGEFRVHYTRQGTHAVASTDADGSGVPDTVERVARLYDEVLRFYRGRGFRAPVTDGDLLDNGGDAAFDVYLVDFNRSADGAYRREACRQDKPAICSGYMVQENDFLGYGYPSVEVAERVVASHELFHAVQAAYDADQGSLLAEGTAVWASEQFDVTLPDFESQIRGYFQNTDRSLDKPLPGPVDPFSYGSAIYFQYLSERLGMDVIRELLEATEDGAGGTADPAWYTLLPAFLEARGSSFADSFATFVAWNTFTGPSATAGYGYARARNYPGFARTAVTAPVAEEALRVFYASAQGFTVGFDGRDPLEVALVADDLDGVVLMTAPMVAGRVQAPPTLVGAPWRASLSTAGIGNVVVVVINTNTAGNSKRPTLCAGTPAEVADCVAAHGGPAVDAGVGAPDAAAPDGATPDAAEPVDSGAERVDAGVSAPDAGTPAPPLPKESSCASARGSTPTLVAVTAVLLALAARRRRH